MDLGVACRALLLSFFAGGIAAFALLSLVQWARRTMRR